MCTSRDTIGVGALADRVESRNGQNLMCYSYDTTTHRRRLSRCNAPQKVMGVSHGWTQNLTSVIHLLLLLLEIRKRFASQRRLPPGKLMSSLYTVLLKGRVR